MLKLSPTICLSRRHQVFTITIKMDQRLPLREEPPKPNIPSDLLRNPGNLEPNSNRAILGPLPKVNNDQEYSHSSLHASAEALLLLNNARVDFVHSMAMGPGKENERNFEIPITAPIPLSYSVRGVEALRSILSVGEGVCYVSLSLLVFLRKSKLKILDRSGRNKRAHGFRWRTAARSAG